MFLDLVQRLERYRAGRQVICLHLSRLSSSNNKKDFLRIATESFSSYVSGLEGHLFKFETGDLVFVAKDATPTLLESAIDRIKGLFSQDPLIETRTEDGKFAFYSWYDLEKDYDSLFLFAKDTLKDAERICEEEASAPVVYKKKIESVSPEVLAKLEYSLDNVDVTSVARRQTICTLIDEVNPQPLFEEVFISIKDLEKAVVPDIDLTSDPWLFRYLTSKLDRRVMLMLIRDGLSTTRPFSLNLNISTVLSPDFAKFENVIAPQLKGRLVIEMNKLDVFADMNAFLFARDYLHEHGFRLCLDGLTHLTLPYYDRAKLGFDLVKIFWAPNALDTMPRSQITSIRNLIKDTGQAHTILCRCNDGEAVQMGQELGIVMFQGRHLDKLMAPPRPPIPTRLRV